MVWIELMPAPMALTNRYGRRCTEEDVTKRVALGAILVWYNTFILLWLTFLFQGILVVLQPSGDWTSYKTELDEHEYL